MNISLLSIPIEKMMKLMKMMMNTTMKRIDTKMK
jgi:hypothetical protein